VKEHRQNEVNQDQIINLTEQGRSDSITIDALELKLELADAIEEHQDSIIDLTEEQAELTEKELRRQKRRATWSKVWAVGKYVLIGIGSGAAGYGIGSIVP